MLAASEPETFHYEPGLGIIASHGRAQILVGNRALLAQQGVDATFLAQPTEGQTCAHDAPPLVDTNNPSLDAARISAPAPPPGAIASDHVRTLRRAVHAVPPLVDAYNPPVVAARRC